jgi:hypothetical protein
MFRAFKRSVTIEVSCENSTIEIKSLIQALSNNKGNKVIAENEKALLLGYLIDQQGRVSEEELVHYFTGRGWQVLK